MRRPHPCRKVRGSQLTLLREFHSIAPRQIFELTHSTTDASEKLTSHNQTHNAYQVIDDHQVMNKSAPEHHSVIPWTLSFFSFSLLFFFFPFTFFSFSFLLFTFFLTMRRRRPTRPTIPSPLPTKRKSRLPPASYRPGPQRHPRPLVRQRSGRALPSASPAGVPSFPAGPASSAPVD